MGKVSLGVRVDGDWPGLIDEQAKALGISRAEWLQGAIGSKLGVEVTVNGSVNAVNPVNARLDAIEGAIAQLREVLTLLTNAPKGFPPPPPIAVVNTSQVSDATLRRLAKKAGLGLADFAAREGWLKQGTGNRAIWIKE